MVSTSHFLYLFTFQYVIFPLDCLVVKLKVQYVAPLAKELKFKDWH